MFWQKWHVTILVLLSLLLHGLLLVLATFRKRTANTKFKWLIYGINLLSEPIAKVAFGFITAADFVAADKHMMPSGLWAAVMLLHLAGQERLSAYDLDENKLWRGTTGSRLLPVLLHLCVFFQGGDLALPTRILFSLALLRVLARALRLSMGTKDVMNLCNDSIDESLFQPINRDADDPLIVSRAHCLFKTSHHHIAQTRRSNQVEHPQHHQVRAFFLGVTNPRYAIRLVEIELNFLYEAFHTDGTIRKMLNDTYSLLYVVFRIYEFILCLYTLSIYSNIKSQDIYIWVVTNILLGGTVILEVISYILMVFSDWTIASLRSGNCLFRLISKALFKASLHNRRQWWSNYATTHQILRILFRRWSETISNFNFVRYSTQPHSLGNPLRFFMMRPLDVMFGTQNTYTSFMFVSNVLYSEQLGIFIFQELQNKRNNQQSVTFFEDDENFNSTVLKWHIITELLHNYQLGDADHQSEEQDNYCRHSKLISDYMSYIFFMKLKSGNNPLVKSQTAQLRIQSMPAFPPLVNEDYRTNCKEILNSCLSDESRDDDYYVTSVRCAISTASELIGRREGKIPWKEITEQWINILVIAARKYKRFDHVRGLCHGGELLSIVWLLAFHLGFYHQESGSSSSSV